MTESEEDDQEQAEVTKICKFYEFVHDKTKIGLPARKVTYKDTFNSEI